MVVKRRPTVYAGPVETLDRGSSVEADDPLLALIDAGNAVQKILEQRLAAIELTPAQQRALGFIAHSTEALTPTTLASLLRQEVQSVSGLLAGLESRGLIKRRRHPLDRRSIRVGLTERGATKMREAAAIVGSLSAEFDARLNIDAKVLLTSLESTRDRLMTSWPQGIMPYRKVRQ
jgi:DNA-binding MarR family transcriptional regulator